MKKRTSITLNPELLVWVVPYLRKNKTSLSAMVNKMVLDLSSSTAEKEKTKPEETKE